MRDRFIAGGLFALGLVILGASYLSMTGGVSAQAYSANDTGGPYLVVEVAGEANGTIRIDLRPDIAPQHVERIVTLAERGDYDGVVFHRVIDGFMAQTGDVQYGQAGGDTARAGMGGSDLGNIPAEFSGVSFERGVLGMARSQSPDSANSQFFIMFAPAAHLNGQYTVVGQVVEGIEVVDVIKRGRGGNGAVTDPDRMVRVTVEN